MDSVELHQLAAQGESERLEFKKTTGELHAGMETLCALLNGSGGKVLFGVTNSGRIVGQDVSDATLQEVAAAIRKIEPHAWIDQTRIPVSDGREVLMLETTLQADSPYAFDGRAYQRIGPTTSRMPQAEYERRLMTRSFGTHRWEEQPALDFALDDLDVGALDSLLNAAVACGRLERRPGSHEEALDKLRLRVEGHLVQAAVVLLAREVMPHYPQCTMRMARFRGIDKLGDFLDQRQLYGHAFQLLNEAELFLRRHIPVAGHFEPDNWVRQDRPAYPYLALREALVNAICHRDYSIVGGAIYVAIYDDRLEITSAGILPPGITVQDLKRVHMSVPRNATVADAFFRAGLIERWGRGTLKIVDLCREAGQPEPEFEVQAGHVVVRFRPGEYVPPTQVQHSLTERQREILAILSGGAKWRFRDILERLSDPPAQRTLRDDLQLLRRLGLVESGGRSVAARWWLRGSTGDDEKGGEGRRKAEKGG